MARRRFSRPPTIGKGSRAPNRVVQGELPQEIRKFKDTYVFERQVLEQFRGVVKIKYKPSITLDGKSRWDTPEERRKPVNVWNAVYRKLERTQNFADPCRYVRIIFYILRGSAVAVPTVHQLGSPKVMEMIAEFMVKRREEIRQQFVADSQRAKSSITINQKGAGYPLGLSVYYAITDSRLGLSPLFRYCIASETIRQLEEGGSESENCERLKSLAKQFELYAAMDYTLFPDDYDQVWGSVIPSDFRVVACNLLEAVMRQ